MTATAPSEASDRERVRPSGDWLPQAPAGVYVHVPFCVSQCPYCDFVVYAGAGARGPRNRMVELSAALNREPDLRADLLDGHFGAPGEGRPRLGSVYLGGGTPSLLPAPVVRELLDHVEARLGLAAGAEVTLEANPGRDEIGDLVGFREAGVTRLSVGAQSLDATELRLLGRRHSPADVCRAVHAARQAGLGSVGLDLLTDIPDQSVESWRRTLRAALDLEPDHLSVYALSLDDPDAEGLTGPVGDHLPLSRGARAWRERARGRQSQDRAASMEEVTEELTAAAGLRRYEIANWARPGHQSRHNLLYWRRRAYLALGPGAHAADGALRRTWNAAPLDGYLAALSEAGAEPPRLPPGGEEHVDPDTARAEAAILGLRLSHGIDASLAAHSLIAPGLAWAVSQGLVEREDGRGAGRARLTPKGRLLANEVFMRLLPESAPGARNDGGPMGRGHRQAAAPAYSGASA